MQFIDSSQAIYLQIAEYVCEKILLKEWKAEDKIPSVREMAVQLEVNPNTVMRTYEFLTQQQIIYTQRGLGYFVTTTAYSNAVQYLKQEFQQKILPSVFRNMHLLKVDVDDLKLPFEKYKKQNF